MVISDLSFAALSENISCDTKKNCLNETGLLNTRQQDMINEQNKTILRVPFCFFNK